jgi:hypothetical protein
MLSNDRDIHDDETLDAHDKARAADMEDNRPIHLPESRDSWRNYQAFLEAATNRALDRMLGDPIEHER